MKLIRILSLFKNEHQIFISETRDPTRVLIFDKKRFKNMVLVHYTKTLDIILGWLE